MFTFGLSGTHLYLEKIGIRPPTWPFKSLGSTCDQILKLRTDLCCGKIRLHGSSETEAVIFCTATGVNSRIWSGGAVEF